MPTETKNTPSSSPLKGSMVASMARRYSVSARSRPATKAPSVIERPLAAATRAVATITSRQAAMNSSVERVRATRWKSGRRATRPATTISTRATTACPSARASAPPRSPPSRRPSTAMANRIGATARSWNRRTAKLVRPAGVPSRFCSASTGSTTAVEESASASPTSTAPATGWLSAMRMIAITAAEAATWIEPRPKTSRRSTRSRSQDSSIPIMNMRKITPNSARCAISERLPMVKGASQGCASAKRPRPKGPSSAPAPMKPSTGLTRRRWNSGTTIPAVTRKRIASR